MEIRDKLAYGNTQRVFRAKDKVNEPGHISHITQRAAGKEPLFMENDDYLAMLGLLKESSERFNLEYYALCLMPNHIHVLLEPQLRNLSRAMHFVFSNYAARFNRKYQRKGHLFGGPYRQAVCLDSTYLLSASVYIHLNPVKADLTAFPEDYRWSSCSLYCRGDPKEKSFVDPSPVLELLDDDLASARNEYSRILRYGRGAELDEALEQEGAIERFCVHLANMFPSLFRKLTGKQNKEGSNADDLLDIVCLEEMIRDFDTRPIRDPQGKEAKQYVVQQLLARGFRKTEIADKLQISRKTVYNILNS